MKLAPGLIIAAPGSGSGKTTVTLALLAHLRSRGIAVASAKVGPDFIDPAFHAQATGRPCHNLDAWAMSPSVLAQVASDVGHNAEVVIVEGVMGLFDGAPDGTGSAADLARRTGWPVVLVVDASGMARSVAALVHGFASFDPRVRCAGVIFNKLGSASHASLMEQVMTDQAVPVLGSITRNARLRLPDRHLGLVQAREHPDLQAFFGNAAATVATSVDIDGLLRAATPGYLDAPGSPGSPCSFGPGIPVPPLGQRIAVADDAAFAFAYPYVLEAWRAAGASVHPFSPLANEAPPSQCDSIYLPGGYPELHAAKLAAATQFQDGIRRAARDSQSVYGECGGYMVLGQTLTDAAGQTHSMSGLLPIHTSFEHPRLSLGYRQLTLAATSPLGPAGSIYRGHEFHYASQTSTVTDAPLFTAANAKGMNLGKSGACAGSVFGSYMHLMDRRDDIA